MKHIFNLMAIAALLLAASCSRPAVEENTAEQVALPPSLSDAEVSGAVKTIRLTPEQATALNIRTATVEKGQFEYNLTVPGVVFPSPEHISVLSAPIDGLVIAIHAHEGEAVRRGQTLLELESLEIANLVADHLIARADDTFYQKQLDRMKLLVEKNIRPQRDLERAEADAIRAKAAVQASYARLLALGASEKLISQWETGERAHAHLPITAQIDGIITEHLIDMGQAVNAYQKMGTLVNTSRVLIKGYVDPEEGALLKPGDKVRIALREMPDQFIETRIETVVPTLDELNKSLTVNVLTKTTDNWPRPGQTVRLNIIAKYPQDVLRVPVSAVEFEGDDAAVFVKTGEHTFEKRNIRATRLMGENVIVASGLQPGEAVAISQVFSLKALAKYEEFAEE